MPLERPVNSVALVHDYLLVMRGAERTFAAIADCWPGAPIATLLYDEHATNGHFRGHTVTTSPLQALGIRQRGYRVMLPLFPLAVEALRIPAASVVISSSSAFAHAVRTPADCIHLCYCHSPFRYVYHDREQAIREAPAIVRPALSTLLTVIQTWEERTAQRPTAYIANSGFTRQRIQEFWGRHAAVVHPPVDVERFHVAEPEDYFLVVCELVPHKRVDVALEAARLARRPIAVVGEGPQRRYLEARFGDVATFHGRASDERLAELYARALALVVPSVEEFGIAAVEAQAAGRPVIALGRGGVAETVIPGKTGVLVEHQDAAHFAEAMVAEDFTAYDTARIRRNAERFTRREFQRKLVVEVNRWCQPTVRVEMRPAGIPLAAPS
jgi:glycosyltransferase involved in cell wall biosynthesis